MKLALTDVAFVALLRVDMANGQTRLQTQNFPTDSRSVAMGEWFAGCRAIEVQSAAMLPGEQD